MGSPLPTSALGLDGLTLAHICAGTQGVIPTGSKDLEDALEMGMDWSLREGSDLPVPTDLFPLICSH
jgi:hypothetical protein